MVSLCRADRWPTSREEAESVAKELFEFRRHRSRGQSADSCRRPRQRRRREDRQVGGRSRRPRRQDARHEAGHAPDRPRRPHRAPLADRRNAAHREGTLSGNSGRSRRRQAGVHGVGRGRHGDRAGRRRKSRRDPEAAHRSRHGARSLSGAQDRIQARPEARSRSIPRCSS